jgi:hypothetical protein
VRTRCVIDDYVDVGYSEDHVNTQRVLSTTRAGLQGEGPLEVRCEGFNFIESGRMVPSARDNLRRTLRSAAGWDTESACPRLRGPGYY